MVNMRKIWEGDKVVKKNCVKKVINRKMLNIIENKEKRLFILLKV